MPSVMEGRKISQAQRRYLEYRVATEKQIELYFSHDCSIISLLYRQLGVFTLQRQVLWP